MARRNRRRLGQQDPRDIFPVPEGADPVVLDEDDARPLLESGEVTGGHRMPWGSNYTFLVWIDAGPGRYLRAIYKPRDGERPLWDFPAGTLYKREFASFLLSRLLGWPNIPLTVMRDGPYGIGMFQHYIDADPEFTYFEMVERGDSMDELCRIMVFDLIVNNADRKAGHCLMGADNRIWSIDHGLAFHTAFKLRTVMMEFWGRRVPDELISDLSRLYQSMESESAETAGLRSLVNGAELKALKKRILFLIREPVIPNLDPNYNVPWPFI